MAGCRQGLGQGGVNIGVGGFGGRDLCFRVGVLGGQAQIDRELYLPVSWTADRDRCTEAGISTEVGFATKPAALIVEWAKIQSGSTVPPTRTDPPQASGLLQRTDCNRCSVREPTASGPRTDCVWTADE